MLKKAFLLSLALCSLGSVYGQQLPANTGQSSSTYSEETINAQQNTPPAELEDNFFIEEDKHTSSRTSIATTTDEAAAPKPARAIPANLIATNIGDKSAVLHWASVHAVNSYDIRVKSTASTTWTVFNRVASFAQISGFKPGTSYEYQVRSNMGNVSSPYSASMYFTTSTTPTAVSYCKSAGSEASRAWIAKVELASIHNTSGPNGGYANFSNLSTDLLPAKSYTISVTPGFEGAAHKTGFKVWIDYNNNGSFEDSGELVMEKTAHNKHTHSASFTVPYHTKTGKVRMRVAMKAEGLPTACETFASGEVEDYTINILANPANVHASGKHGASAVTKNEFKLFPNPTRDNTTVLLNLSAHNGPVVMQVFDIQGKLVLTRQYPEGTQHLSEQLNLAEHPEGTYYIKIKTGDTSMVRKLVLINKSSNFHM
jgi:bacillolysin